MMVLSWGLTLALQHTHTHRANTTSVIVSDPQKSFQSCDSTQTGTDTELQIEVKSLNKETSVTSTLLNGSLITKHTTLTHTCRKWLVRFNQYVDKTIRLSSFSRRI